MRFRLPFARFVAESAARASNEIYYLGDCRVGEILEASECVFEGEAGPQQQPVSLLEVSQIAGLEPRPS